MSIFSHLFKKYEVPSSFFMHSAEIFLLEVSSQARAIADNRELA